MQRGIVADWTHQSWIETCAPGNDVWEVNEWNGTREGVGETVDKKWK